MSEVKVKCPKCNHISVLDSVDLNKTQGRAVCSSCNHIFQLVKKSKKAQQPNGKLDAKPTEKAAPQAQANTTKPTAPKKETEKKAALQGEVLAKEAPKEKSAADKLREQTAKSLDAFFSAHNKNAHDKKESATPQIAKTVHEISKQQHHEQRPLQYRVPRADGMAHTFAEVGNGTAFSLLDRDSISSQLPQIAMKPAAKNSKLPVTRIIATVQQAVEAAADTYMAKDMSSVISRSLTVAPDARVEVGDIVGAVTADGEHLAGRVTAYSLPLDDPTATMRIDIDVLDT